MRNRSSSSKPSASSTTLRRCDTLRTASGAWAIGNETGIGIRCCVVVVVSRPVARASYPIPFVNEWSLLKAGRNPNAGETIVSHAPQG